MKGKLVKKRNLNNTKVSNSEASRSGGFLFIVMPVLITIGMIRHLFLNCNNQRNHPDESSVFQRLPGCTHGTAQPLLIRSPAKEQRTVAMDRLTKSTNMIYKIRYLLFLVAIIGFNCNQKKEETNKNSDSKIDVVDVDDNSNRDTNKTEKESSRINMPTSTSMNAWDSLKTNYDKALVRLDPILNANPKLQQQPSALLLKIKKQISNIRVMLDDRNTSDADVELTRKMIADLNQLIDQLESGSFNQ